MTADSGSRAGAVQSAPPEHCLPADNGHPAPVDPDLDFIREVADQAGGSFKRCFQCGTCSSTCDLSPELAPFPRKEMSWAAWGLRDRLLADPDVWLCHQCNDCSSMCPRGGRPGDVLAAVRRECIAHYATPRVLGAWVRQPAMVPFLLAIPAAILALTLGLAVPVAEALGITAETSDKIVFSYSYMLPHWLLNTLFLSVTGLVVIALGASGARFWRAIRTGLPLHARGKPKKGMLASIGAGIKRAFMHDDFGSCTQSKPRRLSHLAVFFGFLALIFVTLWVITIRINPLAGGEFAYPFGFFSPMKILANLGGIAVLAGLVLMVRDRILDQAESKPTFFDWSLIGTIALVVLTGFIVEFLHYLRLEPHRHVAYYVHLVLALSLILYLPYSKLAHVLYRTLALIYAERIGRRPAPTGGAIPEADHVDA